MEENKKKKREMRGLLGLLPQSLMVDEIFSRLELDSLCSTAAVCRAMRVYASQALSSISILDLSGYCVDERVLNHILGVGENKVLKKSLTLNCFRLPGSSIAPFLTPNLHQLGLLKCSLLSSHFLVSIGQSCPNLRVLVLEILDHDPPQVLKHNLRQMLKGCSHLESLSLKLRRPGVSIIHPIISFVFPKAIKILQLQPVLEQDVIYGIRDKSIPFSLEPTNFKLQTLSLVLDIISDDLILTITHSLPLLAELDLKDKPTREQLLQRDFTNIGVQSLASCSRLTRLSLRRSRQNSPTSTFARVNDLAFFLLLEGCISLESVRLDGFSKVTDAGFISILHSCESLKTFEVFNSDSLTDLTFHDLTDAPCSLIEVGLVSCRHITSETVEKFSLCKNLVVFYLSGCKSVSDRWLKSVSALSRLTTLNLCRANVTDNGLSALCSGNAPIASLCLRGCERVTDQGVALLFQGGSTISTTLTILDLGDIPNISDMSIFAIARYGLGVTDLCIKYCILVTDAALKALASKRRLIDGSKPIQRLDLYKCTGLSLDSFGLLKRPSFPRLNWLGVGNTCFSDEGYADFAEISSDRPWLTVCFDGCEIGCGEGWHDHF
ncbi:hypothetical protein GIB67_033340 [Kingdonia uniflora]|uniref:F-box/LRR-repeat protein 15-like leucin rich repeat domain-containing protein n=1 Tax=Kingdonia uniflora TaxID=39325 RepID=A0A7J7LTI4_9MAGN|nr:hypothetical protein GIB67_033340 [Kingdonia uniflora]